MNDSDALSELKQFLGTHFHEDWMEEATSAEIVVKRFLATKPDASKLSYLARGVELFLAKHPSEPDLEAALHAELWCYYAPDTDGKTVRAWLESLQAMFVNEAERREQA